MRNKKDINEWSRKEFEALPHREWGQDIGLFDSLVILPTKHVHDSGYMCMDFIAVRNNEPFMRISGCSDVIHINGIGGFGKYDGFIPRLIPPIGWSIDCLRKSKLLRLFSHEKLEAGEALSSFVIYSTKK